MEKLKTLKDIYTKMSKDPKKVARGKKSKAAGNAFELRVREDLTLRDWYVAKYPNNVQFMKEGDKDDGYGKDIKRLVDNNLEATPGKIVAAKHKFRGFGIPMAMGTGFPDFIAFRHCATAPQGKSIIINNNCEGCGLESQVVKFNMSAISEVIGVEAKSNGKLSKEEQKKCKWYLDNRVFSKILIAKKTKEGRKIKVIYTDFMEQYG